MTRQFRERLRVVKTSRQPLRTCVGCRRRATQQDLLRMVVTSSDGVRAVVVDVRQRLAGRGAWVHPSESCVMLALKRRAFNRAFRGAVDTRAVEAYIAAAESPSAPAAPPQPSTVKAGQK